MTFARYALLDGWHVCEENTRLCDDNNVPAIRKISSYASPPNVVDISKEEQQHFPKQRIDSASELPMLAIHAHTQSTPNLLVSQGVHAKLSKGPVEYTALPGVVLAQPIKWIHPILIYDDFPGLRWCTGLFVPRFSDNTSIICRVLAVLAEERKWVLEWHRFG